MSTISNVVPDFIGWTLYVFSWYPLTFRLWLFFGIIFLYSVQFIQSISFWSASAVNPRSFSLYQSWWSFFTKETFLTHLWLFCTAFKKDFLRVILYVYNLTSTHFSGIPFTVKRVKEKKQNGFCKSLSLLVGEMPAFFFFFLLCLKKEQNDFCVMRSLLVVTMPLTVYLLQFHQSALY